MQKLLDFGAGEIDYKISINAEKNKLTNANIESFIYAKLGTMDCYLPEIKGIIERENISIKEATEIIEI
ncbi:MAG: hypothetical protein QNJ38_13680 [Prochloraceae cyanobacterium]|nr:hypothetical protein [Prochloraceae cyanobacterium]